MEEEMKAIADSNSWTPAALPTGSRAIGLKLVFKLKKYYYIKIKRKYNQVIDSLIGLLGLIT